MPPFATTGGISGAELKAASRAQYRTIHNSRNHPKVPDEPQADGTFCALHSADIGSAFTALGGFGPRSLYEIEDGEALTKLCAGLLARTLDRSMVDAGTE